MQSGFAGCGDRWGMCPAVVKGLKFPPFCGHKFESESFLYTEKTAFVYCNSFLAID